MANNELVWWLEGCRKEIVVMRQSYQDESTAYADFLWLCKSNDDPINNYDSIELYKQDRVTGEIMYHKRRVFK